MKTIQYKSPNYVGDPLNTVRIFSDKEVDELIFLDIFASKNNTQPNLEVIREIAEECFVPFSYGGGVRSIEHMRSLFELGVEKISLNTIAIENPEFVSLAAKEFGNQSVIASVDVKKKLLSGYQVINPTTGKSIGWDPVKWCQHLESLGAGEILLTSVDLEGTLNGFDLELIRQVSNSVSIPVIAHGGAGSVDDLSAAIHGAQADAVAAGSLFVYQVPNRSVLINFPTLTEIRNSIWRLSS